MTQSSRSQYSKPTRIEVLLRKRTSKDHAVREDLSRKTPALVKIVNIASFLFFLLIAIGTFLIGGKPIVPSALVLLSAGSFFFYRGLATVSIDNEALYVRRYSTEIRVDPTNIEDVDFWRWSRFLVLKFKTPTELGTSVLFEPTGGAGAMETTIRGAEAFEKIGKLCEWRS